MKSARGFTLVEVLLAIVLLGLLLGMAWQGLSAGARIVTGAQQVIDQTNRVRVAQELLRRQIGNALALAQESSDDGVRVVFRGESDSFTYVSAMPGYLGRGGPYVQRLSIERGPRGLELLFAHSLLAGFDPERAFDDPDQPPIVLLDEIEQARFEYLGLDDRGDAGEWEGRWENEQLLPLMVRIVVEPRSEAKLHWPDLEVALRLDASAVGRFGQEPTFMRRPGG